MSKAEKKKKKKLLTKEEKCKLISGAGVDTINLWSHLV